MTETDFLARADSTLSAIASLVEQAAEEKDLDVECTRSGNVLEIELVETASKIIINSQAPMQQIWVAAKSGGFHFGWESGNWIDTRDGTELIAALSRIVSTQSGQPIVLKTD